jgi:hypothetical protein
VSEHSTEAWKLALAIAQRFGMRPGDVTLSWDRGDDRPQGHVPRWRVEWSDGPTVAAMRAVVPPLAGPALWSGTDRRLAYARRLTDQAWAVQLIGAVQAGEDLGDVDAPWWRERWGRRLITTEFPERAGNPEQGRLARALLALTSTYPDERELARLLIAHGLAGLARGAEDDPTAIEGLERDRREDRDR